MESVRQYTQGDYNRNDPNEWHSCEFRVDIDWHRTRQILFIEEPIHLPSNQVLELFVRQLAMEIRTSVEWSNGEFSSIS